MKIVFHKSGGPIVIGQAAEFDYAGTQACRALIEKNYGRRLREPLCVVCRGTAPHGFFYRPR